MLKCYVKIKTVPSQPSTAFRRNDVFSPYIYRNKLRNLVNFGIFRFPVLPRFRSRVSQSLLQRQHLPTLTRHFSQGVIRGSDTPHQAVFYGLLSPALSPAGLRYCSVGILFSRIS